MASASGSGKAKGGGGHGGTSESGKRYKFDAALIDAQLMKRCDSRISEADWKNLITYWRSSVFEAVKLVHQPRRDQVYIETNTCKKGDKKGSYVPQAEATIKYLVEKAEKRTEWKEKAFKKVICLHMYVE
ncbi:hypothetical protein VPH35_127515 [Triticum aestivum]|uniref:uncharacterized protein isoform X2 n=1 Tax=Triticum aestivum TaxID=4565 RepID=UPI001D01CE1E|nr:uncharacterized protein LOC123137234 isoform X2 [Triticum aestivum]